MKNILITGTLCSMFLLSTSPSLAQLAGPVNPSTSASSSSSSAGAASQFTLPNYWGDSRLKDRSSAASSPASNSGQSQSSGSKGGGGGSGMGMGMMMMPLMMLMRTPLGRGMGRPHAPKPQKDDDDQRKNDKHHNKQAQQMNDEQGMPDPINAQAMTPLSRKTFDLQNNNAAPPIEEQKRVSGVVQDDEGQVPGTDF